MPFSVFNAAGAALSQSLTDTPVGSIQPFAGASAPSGWLLCDGAAVSRTDYAELFAVLGTTYGTGNGSTTFNVPDLRGRVPAGLDNMGGNAASRLTNTVLSASNTLGATGGAQTHTLATSETPSHTHTVNIDYLDPVTGHNHGSRGGQLMQGSLNRSGASTDANTMTSVGGGGAHTNTQPTLVVNYIILASSLATRLQAAALPQYVTSLPSSPVDGQTVVYAADASNGVMWTLRYRAASSSSYKWEFIGGPPLSSQVDTLEYTTSSSYTALATAGPSIALPLAGDYDVKIGAYIQHPLAQSTFWMSYDIGATGAVDNDGIRRDQYNADSPRSTANNYRTRRKTGLSAVTLTAKYKSGGSGNCGWGDRTMIVTPVRVG